MANNNWQDKLALFKEHGVLCKQLYAVFTKPTGGLDAVMENMKDHLAYQVGIEEKGIMFAAGPFADAPSVSVDCRVSKYLMKVSAVTR